VRARNTTPLLGIPALLGGVLSIITLLAAPSDAPALARAATCGDTVTSDTALTPDLFNCPDSGILIGADDPTLDLNGHTINANDALVDVCPNGAVCDVGVDNTAEETTKGRA
jgi:hypothetical protein